MKHLSRKSTSWRKRESLEYNDEPTVELSENRVHYVWQERINQSPVLLEQQIELVGEYEIKAHYNEKKNETRIVVCENGEESAEVQTGLTTIKFKSENGSTKYGL